MIDTQKIRRDFPTLERVINNKPLVYLDSSASSLKPIQVIEALEDIYKNHYANIHRGIYALSTEATALYDGARKKIARFINASSRREIIFTRNTTESINLVAYSWGISNLKQGDAILISEIEHHANLIPWQQLGKQTGAELRFIPVGENGALVLDDIDRLLDQRVKIVAVTAMSNVLGTIPPIAEIISRAREVGAVVLIDGAQSVPHMPTDVQAMDCDFLAFSSHKMLGPTGVGVLYGKQDILRQMPPFLTGGDMMVSVDYDGARWADIPEKFEAGTPPIAEVYGLGIAVDYLSNIGMENIRKHEIALVEYTLEKLSMEEGVHIFGPLNPVERGGAISFTLGDIHPHDLSSILDSEGIAIRAGHHCAMPLHKKLNVPATARSSTYIYNTTADIDRLTAGLDKARQIFGS